MSPCDIARITRDSEDARFTRFEVKSGTEDDVPEAEHPEATVLFVRMAAFGDRPFR